MKRRIRISLIDELIGVLQAYLFIDAVAEASVIMAVIWLACLLMCAYVYADKLQRWAKHDELEDKS